MPLARRLGKELLPEWGDHCLAYKELQREAESLVGVDGVNEENEAVFKFHLSYAIEQANEFYLQKESQAKEAFASVAHAVETVAQVHGDREAKSHRGAGGGASSVAVTPSSPDSSPTTSSTLSTDNLWGAGGPPLSHEERETLETVFEGWKKWAHATRRHTLSDYINDAFMVQLEAGALKAALLDWLKLLMFIDHIRNFAMLNSVAALKLIERHTSDAHVPALRALLQQQEVFRMQGLCDMVHQMEDVALKLSSCLHNEAPHSPVGVANTWSPHVCPFCSKTVSNAVIMPTGRTCCWLCSVDTSSSCIFTCPLTAKPQDLRSLRAERVLSRFLQRYFPAAYRSGPGEVTGNSANMAKDKQVQQRTAHGILSMFKVQAEKKEAEAAAKAQSFGRTNLSISIPENPHSNGGKAHSAPGSQASTPSPRSGKKSRTPRSSMSSSPSMDFDFLGQAVQGMLQQMHESPIEESSFGRTNLSIS
eukprot:CAMPEP_0173430402 /NCGR_PEP_ID=MMETSP1357-20121228/8834_1 /TAXON_ID=77926 /ORGANISM="Hemiselmis rufescens, Strain PCC563" /LENGTH=476 /DNA_ID=CAMNT_0014394731 /DNA_START=59 /DNA_END=1486 /DNA_ORIENTATION=-